MLLFMSLKCYYCKIMLLRPCIVATSTFYFPGILVCEFCGSSATRPLLVSAAYLFSTIKCSR